MIEIAPVTPRVWASLDSAERKRHVESWTRALASGHAGAKRMLALLQDDDAVREMLDRETHALEAEAAELEKSARLSTDARALAEAVQPLRAVVDALRLRAGRSRERLQSLRSLPDRIASESELRTIAALDARLREHSAALALERARIADLVQKIETAVKA